MKKAAYYISPFVILPIVFLIASLLERAEAFVAIVPWLIFTTLFLFAVVIGTLSQSKAKFDYVMTALIPLSVFFALFIALLFDEGCDGMPQLSVSHALNLEYYRIWLPTALVVTAVSFVFSFNPIRTFIKGKIHFIKNQGGHE